MVLITVADACLLLKISRRTLYRMIRSEVLPQPRRMDRFRQAYFDYGEFQVACRQALA
ncbi:helix-turn-helix transcriptional regulator [Ramlibacter sp. MMS24-I3-19]|uniref:helix-turn-helix transcriptional regulator n=1 Tax=Ramlibacter sp. MMS24-I3-19 TaxID=3416606 RepID=UPI003CFCE175